MDARFRRTFVWMVLLACAGAAWGQPPCSETVKCVPIATQELWELPTLQAQFGVLITTLDVRFKSMCVPTAETRLGSGIWNTEPRCLRTYVYPGPGGRPTWGYKDARTGNLMAFPGPTLRLRKKGPTLRDINPLRPGDRLELTLLNNLDPSPHDKCNSACQDRSITCPVRDNGKCDSAFLDKLVRDCANPASSPRNCCCIVDCTQELPNCFHEDNTTNLHFHGSHVSPQKHQDYVLLELRPEKERPKEGEAPRAHGAHGEYSEVAYGRYDYDIPEFGPTQPEGTHWYHPHKHGSTSIQMLNGMAGALIITGALDEWLDMMYGRMPEKILMIQQISQDVNLFIQGSAPPRLLVNGQVKPNITVRPGEIQRWRLINATMTNGAQLEVTFPPNLQFRQMALDGIQFSPENYRCQPLYNFNPTSVNPPDFRCNPNPTAPPVLTISPGNRVDYLVQIPTKEGTYTVRRKTVGGMGEQGEQKILLRDQALTSGEESAPALFTVVVDDGIPGNEDQPHAEATLQLPSPAEWPPLPSYLRDITTEDTKGNAPVSISWQQIAAGLRPENPPQPWPYGNRAFTKFLINGKQFDSECANVTTKLDTALQWTVENTTRLNHPFHIHTNPFQLINFKGVALPNPVWMDTIALPQATLNPNRAPTTLPARIDITPSSLTFRQRYELFTGQYVLHCHFLGHEDRGMMFSVQTVCAGRPDFYGQPGMTSECSVKVRDALSACK
ncbi:MAG TPA: multicopper oxidase domain-containing protein [Thermoanaerobaculia bacterium]|nr:multicopper oxidase domain-containing protein [Thermoanaerobaculia bacterium]